MTDTLTRTGTQINTYAEIAAAPPGLPEFRFVEAPPVVGVVDCLSPPMTTDGPTRPPPHFGPSDIAGRILRILEEKQWSQRELSRRAGLNPSQVGNVLRALGAGRMPERETLMKIAAAAGEPPDYLTGKIPHSAFRKVESILREAVTAEPNGAAPTPGQHPANPALVEFELSLFHQMAEDAYLPEDFDIARQVGRDMVASNPQTFEDPRPIRESLLAMFLLDAALSLRLEGLPRSPYAVALRAIATANAYGREPESKANEDHSNT